MKLFLKTNVFEEALDRIRWVYDEFPHVFVSFSGGKDSTVVLELALMVARERSRLPLDVMFLDQEAEWQATIDYMRLVQRMPEVRLFWLQAPFRLFNATSPFDPWLYCWEPGQEWMREKEPDSIHENLWGEDRFTRMFLGWQYRQYGYDSKVASLAGVRCQESPGRYLGLTTSEVYKGVTWGAYVDNRFDDKGNPYVGDDRWQVPRPYRFYPIYDWLTNDIWKAIHENGWPYCKLYDLYYQYGVPLPRMRLSSLHHESAIASLYLLQEIEPDTWRALTKRLSGINTAAHLGTTTAPKELPFMFKDWTEYRDYLLENLWVDEEAKRKMRQKMASFDPHYIDDPVKYEALVHAEIHSILVNDYWGQKLTTWGAAHWKPKEARKKRKVRSG